MRDPAEVRQWKLDIVEYQGKIWCVYLNDFRIAGSKPYAGNRIVRSFTVTLDDLVNACAFPPKSERFAAVADAAPRLSEEARRVLKQAQATARYWTQEDRDLANVVFARLTRAEE